MNTKAHVWITFLVAMIATLGQTTAIIKEGHRIKSNAWLACAIMGSIAILVGQYQTIKIIKKCKAH
jgi:hypothetical protein